MEEYIFNCYKKWVKEQNGNISKQLSRLTKAANALIILLVVTMAAIIITYILSVCNVINVVWITIPALLEAIIGIISYVYTSKYEINHSDNALNEYQQYCDNLSDMLTERNITSRPFLEEIIGRYKVLIDDSSKKIERNQDRINKVMQILIIPVFLAVLGNLLSMQTDAQSAIETGIALSFVIAFIYFIGFYPVYIYNNLTIKKRQNNYKQFVTDLQGIIDFERCETSLIEETV